MRKHFLICCCFYLLYLATPPPTSSGMGSVADLSNWNITSYKVDLQNHRGGSGDIQQDQRGWVHLGANHLEGGDIRYVIHTGKLNRDDILEVWIDGYSSSNNLQIGPTVFIGTGKHRFEHITRTKGEAWRPCVFRFADEDMYGDVTDPAVRNMNWRMRYPSSKYDIRRIDKSPRDLQQEDALPIQISITGSEDFIIKRMEVIVYRAQPNNEPFAYQMAQKSVEQPPRPKSSVPAAVQQQLAATFSPPLLPPVPSAPQRQIEVRTSLEASSPTLLPPEAYQAPLPTSDQQIQPVIQMTPQMNTPVAPFYMAAPYTTVPFGGYTIQIGAYQNQASAFSSMRKAQQYGYQAYIDESFQNGMRMFRVRVGNYPDKGTASQHVGRLRYHGFDTWITSVM